MIDRTLDRFGLYPKRLAADAAYGSAENLAWLVHERGIEPHIPVFDHSQHRDGTFHFEIGQQPNQQQRNSISEGWSFDPTKP